MVSRKAAPIVLLLASVTMVTTSLVAIARQEIPAALTCLFAAILSLAALRVVIKGRHLPAPNPFTEKYSTILTLGFWVFTIVPVMIFVFCVLPRMSLTR